MKHPGLKKFTTLFVTAAMSLSLMACGDKSGSTVGAAATTAEDQKAGKNLQIVTTIFPEYDWVRQILGENPAGADITLLLDNGADLHSYQPTAEDIAKISTCDLFIYVGGESDEWVNDALKEATNPNMAVIDLLEVLGDSAKQEEVVEGMQADEHDHEHEEGEGHEADEDHDGDAHHHDEREIEYDEHVWLSVKNAKIFVNEIREKVSILDAANADAYKKNAEAYNASLTELDEKYTSLFSNAKEKTLLFGDRFPFRYMIEDYGLSYYAAFIGCSAETEASFETITFLAGKVDELGLSSIFVLEGGNHKIAETVKNSTKARDQEIVSLNSMQSTTKQDIEGGATYLGIMETNYETLSRSVK